MRPLTAAAVLTLMLVVVACTDTTAPTHSASGIGPTLSALLGSCRGNFALTKWTKVRGDYTLVGRDSVDDNVVCDSLPHVSGPRQLRLGLGSHHPRHVGGLTGIPSRANRSHLSVK